MKWLRFSCALWMMLLLLQGCSTTNGSTAPLSAGPEHADERNIGGHLYRHGRQIHHHPERQKPSPETKQDKQE